MVGGSEDGFVYIWDIETSNLVQKLGPCVGPVYSAQWNNRQSLLASCGKLEGSQYGLRGDCVWLGHDGIVRTWWFDPSVPLTEEEK